ncbi:hypothetical protein CXF79_20480 [Colwellia sp. Bg11-28]|nr:hypothetical protein CXF79_20480 [Colwellia sp. Bg11-28]
MLLSIASYCSINRLVLKNLSSLKFEPLINLIDMSEVLILTKHFTIKIHNKKTTESLAALLMEGIRKLRKLA